VSSFTPTEVWIERGQENTALVRNALSRMPQVAARFFEPRQLPSAQTFEEGKRSLVLQPHRGEFLRHCPAGTAGLVCCNYLVINLASNCPFDCSYCFLQEYLSNNPQLTVFTNFDTALAEVDTVLRARPDRTFRIGTGELSDSLALDPIVGLSRELVPFFAARPNAILELKTKSDCVDDLLDLDPCERVVVSWSVNAGPVVDADEHGTASLAGRIAAARRVQDAGYRLGFHFDPLIEFDGWEEGYRAAIAAIFSAVDPSRVAWVSLGSLRLSPGLEQAMRARRLSRHALSAELVRSSDGKSRLWRGLRLRMYRILIAELHAVDSRLPIYLCMEPPGVWQHVVGEIPTDRELGLRLAAGATW
jgi:spore photoproduct lyase